MIAKVIGVDKSTVSRELKRNSWKRGYRPKQADAFAKDRQQGKSKDRIDNRTCGFIKLLIENDWSPEQIQGWMKEHLSYSVSHEWIYQYILKDKQAGGSLYLHLRCKKKRNKRYGSNDRRGNLKNRVSIDERPDVVEERNRIGDWEADTIIGKAHKQAIYPWQKESLVLPLFTKLTDEPRKTLKMR